MRDMGLTNQLVQTFHAHTHKSRNTETTNRTKRKKELDKTLSMYS